MLGGGGAAGGGGVRIAPPGGRICAAAGVSINTDSNAIFCNKFLIMGSMS